MSDKEREAYLSIIHLQETVINQLIEGLQRFMDCEELPCIKLINEAARIRADMMKKETDIG